MSKKIFISHSSKDNSHVDRIVELLKAADFEDVWVDYRGGLVPGTPSWDDGIREAIVGTDAGIFLMSENSLASGICWGECKLVLELGKPLYVMQLEVCKPENIWLIIKRIQYADLVKDFDKGANDLIRALKGETDTTLPTAVRAAFTGLNTMRLHLPYLNNPLRGRDEDTKQIQSKLGAHVLQIVGPGGLGKSRLAAEIAINQPDGAVWYRCSPVSEPADLVALLREHLKLAADANLTNVLAVLSEKKPLIVVDNAEDVQEGSDKRRAYADLLQQIVGRGVPAMLTTRTVWTELKPRREYPPAAVSLEIASQIALDFASAEAVMLSESQAPELAEKARLHPRLIELAVGQLHERRLDSVLHQLSELKHEDIKEALDEMITKTVEQMAAQARHGADAEALLRRMTILQATFPLDAIKAIAPDEMKNDQDRLQDALVALQRWQFIRRDVTTERFNLGELVREALGQPGDDVFWLYEEYYMKRAEEIFTLSDSFWKQNEYDFPNILSLGDTFALNLLQPHLCTKPIEMPLILLALPVLQFAQIAKEFVVKRPEYRRVAWLEMGLRAAQLLNDETRTAFFAHALGIILSMFGDKQKALSYYEYALPIIRHNENVAAEAALLNGIGSIYSGLGDLRRALIYFEQALQLDVDTLEAKANTLNNIGLAWIRLGETSKGLEYYEQALALYRQEEDQSDKATLLNNIGMAWSRLGDHEKAFTYLDQALELFRSVENFGGEAMTLNNIGTVWRELSDWHQALTYYDQALPLRHKVGDRVGEVNTLNNIAEVLYKLGKVDEAIAVTTKCVELAEQTQHPGLDRNHYNLQQLKLLRDETSKSD